MGKPLLFSWRPSPLSFRARFFQLTPFSPWGSRSHFISGTLFFRKHDFSRRSENLSPHRLFRGLSRTTSVSTFDFLKTAKLRINLLFLVFYSSYLSTGIRLYKAFIRQILTYSSPLYYNLKPYRLLPIQIYLRIIIK